jgi:hypothetical protein
VYWPDSNKVNELAAAALPTCSKSTSISCDGRRRRRRKQVGATAQM